MIDYPALKTELTTDPAALGYAASIANGSHQTLADTMNERRASITIHRSDIPSAEVWEAIAIDDFTALPGNPTAAHLSAERRALAWLSGLPAIGTVRLHNDDGTDTAVMGNLADMFPAGSATRTRLLARAARQGSRAEQLFGAGTVVTIDDVARALRIP